MPAKKVLSASTPEKKPSLASLKPEKGKNIRAQKKAVKKIESHVSKKTSTTKSPIIVKKKSEAIGLGVKRAVKQKKTLAQVEPTVVLPSNMSIRAKEKALVLLEQVIKDFNKSAQQVAYVSGLCFVLLGASMALAFSGTVSSGSQSAMLLGSTTSEVSGVIETTINQTTTNIQLPEISLLDPLPTELRSTSEHKLAVLNVKNVHVKVKSFVDGSIVTTPIDDLSSELYKFVLEADKYREGRHEVRAFVESAFDGSKHEYPLGSFYVPLKQTTQSTASTTTTTTTNNTTTSTVDDIVEEVDEEIDEIDEVTTNIQPTNTATTTNTTVAPTSGPELKVIAPGGDLVGNVLVKVQAPRDLPFVEMYVRAPKSTNSRFVGLAEKRTDYWYFFFNTVNVPNGDYEIVARTRVSGKDYFSSGVKIRIANFVKTYEPVYEVPEEVPEAIEDVQSEDDVDDSDTVDSVPTGRSLPDFSLTTTLDSENNYSPAQIEVADILLPYSEEIKAMLNRYAVAKQSGDKLLIEVAINELQKGKQKIINDILADKSVNYLADEADKVLTERFEMLKKRVDTFEELRTTASNGETASDEDKDGISDFDELNLYNTDPKSPDTDNDGVLDGIEIMKGFDPRNEDAEAVITYELPQESLGIVQEEVLKVESVVPVVKNDDETGKLVQAEIVGKALPNSYVTLYIFSTPTIVTVRADENGAFSYTFEKELEDGEHEVYVAITDNTGAIVAKSNPFRFVKEAEAFTPIDASAGASNVTSFGEISPFNTYNTVVGLGILAFGLILLMLGVSMREKAGVTPQEPSHDLKTS